MAIHNPPEVACSFLGSAYETYMRRAGAQDSVWGGRGEASTMGRAGDTSIAVGVSPRRRVVVDVILLLMRNGRILLRERANTGYGDGAYEPPSGELADRETIVETAIRVASVAGIAIGAENVSLAHVMHDVSGSGRIAFFLSVSGWTGQPTSPDVCWFPVGDLPTNMLDRARVALRNYADGMRFSTYPAFVLSGAGGADGFHAVNGFPGSDGSSGSDESESANGLIGVGEPHGTNGHSEAQGFTSRNGSRARRKEACGRRVLG
jgi:8-oxo-dGTP diphosphatase